jgi:hypothetical protein
MNVDFFQFWEKNEDKTISESPELNFLPINTFTCKILK